MIHRARAKSFLFIDRLERLKVGSSSGFTYLGGGYHLSAESMTDDEDNNGA